MTKISLNKNTKKYREMLKLAQKIRESEKRNAFRELYDVLKNAPKGISLNEINNFRELIQELKA